MTREEKYQVVEELSAKLKETPYFYITDASGMTVKQINAFRRMCFEKGLEYQVVKNTLIRKALETLDTDFSEFSDQVLKGFSGIIFSKESGNLPAKLILEYRKKNPADQRPLLKGASIDTAFFIGNDQVDSLSKLKSRLELIGEVVGLLQSPAQNVISALQGGGHKIAGILKTLEERQSA